MKKYYILEYSFLNCDCSLSYANINDFMKKLDAVLETAEVLQDSIVIRTEEK
jgi:hypothetical protein